MTNYRELFTTWWNSFKESDHPSLIEMKNTVENSPWHREANVFVHTNMVVNKYLEFSEGYEWTRADLLGAIAAVFHDFGKPMSEEEITKDDGSVYRRYAGHETISGGYWMNFWLNNEYDIKSIIPTAYEFYYIHVMIAYHLPYQLKIQRVQELKYHLDFTNTYDAFIKLLRSDAHGRMPDDMESNIARMESWIEKFDDIELLEEDHPQDKLMYTIVGVAGSGKSTWVDTLVNGNDIIFSNDDVRCAVYDNCSYSESFRSMVDYFKNGSVDVSWMLDKLGIAYKKSPVLENENGLLMRVFNDKTSQFKVSSGDFFVDNTNMNYKTRAKYRNAVMRHTPCNAIALLKYAPLDVIIDRNSNRTGKTIPTSVLKGMFYTTFMPPLYGEYYNVIINVE